MLPTGNAGFGAVALPGASGGIEQEKSVMNRQLGAGAKLNGANVARAV